jgi:uncharacterized phiE125 gp8 family phage protein
MHTYPDWHLERGDIVANTEPVTLDVAKMHIRATGNADDVLIQTLCTVAREACEAATNRYLVEGPVTLRLDVFPASGIVIPVGVANVANVTIQYVDVNGDTQTLANTAYRVLQRQHDVPAIVPAFDADFPDTRCERDAVTVTFTCGAQTVAESLKAGMLLTIGYLYENREPKPVELNAINWLWNPAKVVWFG